ncbi:TetR/AcrR family transcriptional regulator [Arthrobacter sp. KNU-44]|uniref:TetR/AcrR family transcriptional regulator n=1 Tax=Arthrobacter sp. KNU-44 TaxID=3450744 RepID=UPI003F43BD7F
MKEPGIRRRNPRGAGANLRAEIVNAANALLEETGSEDAVTLRAIARKARITAPSIYAHFADREAILLEVIREAFDELTASLVEGMNAHTNALDRLRALCSSYVDFALQHPQRYRVLFERNGTRRTATMTQTRPVDQLKGAEAFHQLTTALNSCVREGYSTSAEPDKDAVALWAGIHGYVALQASLPAFPWPKELLPAIVDRLAQLKPAPSNPDERQSGSSLRPRKSLSSCATTPRA